MQFARPASYCWDAPCPSLGVLSFWLSAALKVLSTQVTNDGFSLLG